MPETRETKNSRAKIEANKRYSEKAYDRISLIIPKGQKEVISEHAKKNGESINGFINRAITTQMEQDNNK